MKQKEFLALDLTRRLADKCQSNNILARKKAVMVISFYKFTHRHINLLLTELEESGFIKIVNKRNIKINKEKLKEYDEWF